VNMDDALQAFIAESAELLEQIETGLLACTQGEADPDTINLIFRAAHTLKGSSGLFGLDGIVAFVHGMETVLDRVRQGSVQLDSALVTVLLSCKDHVAVLMQSVNAGPGGAAFDAADRSGAHLQQQLRELGGDFTSKGGAAAATPAGEAAAAGAANAGAAGHTPADHWHLSLRFGPEVLAAGMDPMSFLRYLGSFGSVIGVMVVAERLPEDPAAMNPEHCYLGFEVGFRTSADRQKIESAFEFVRDDLKLGLLQPGASHAAYVTYLREWWRRLSDEGALRTVLARCGGLAAAEIDAALKPPAAPERKNAAAAAPRGQAAERTVRVAADKLDHLITSIGELITAAASANLLARRSGNTEFEESTATVSALIEEVRESALQLRMVKIGATFARFQRVVHDVARELGKQITLEVSGEDSELDKTVVEQIGDPLTHLVRNSMDHGIEPAEARIAKGKPAGGTVRLNAFHDSGSIVIEVSDDGGGLRKEKILAKAVERGLVEEGRTLTDGEIFNLIFEPGFSTADKVTNLSGRGVGMDVVKRNITALRGTINIRSEADVGTTISIRLPLTLAIINGFQVAIGKSIFVLPLESIEECVEFSATPGHDFTSLRGEVMPFIQLRELFATPEPAARRQSIVVLRHGGQRSGLVVDALLGEFQTVIKPLGKMFSQVDCISGSSILGTGEVALILDVPALVDLAVVRSRDALGQDAAAA